MNRFNQLKLRQKVGLSFGLLIALMLVNAVVVVLAALSVAQQIGYQKQAAQVFSNVDQVRLTVGRYVATHSRESAEQVFMSLATTRREVEAANQVLSADQLQGRLLSLLDDLRLHFQKYVVESDQKSALESRAFKLGRLMADQLQVAQSSPVARRYFDQLDAFQFQLQVLQWEGQTLQAKGAQATADPMDSIRQTMAKFSRGSSASQANQATALLLFRIDRDAADYVASFERYLRYQRLSANTERILVNISDQIQGDVGSANISITLAIRSHIVWAVGLTLMLFLLSVGSAVVLTRYLGREILRPVRVLADVTREIASGNLQARASVGVNDEVGELSSAFNQMACNLAESRAELLDKQRALQWAQDGLEQRIDERTGQLVAANDALSTQMAELAQAQAALQLANQVIGARELLVSQIMDTAPIAVFLVDMTGCITQANQSMVDMFGYPMCDLIGKEYVALVDPVEIDLRRKRMLALMNSEIAIVDLDLKFYRANGDEFWAHLTGKLIRGVADEKLGLVGVIADITAQRAHQQQLEAMAHFDALTGLPNRLLLADRLQQAMAQCQRKGGVLAVAYLDLDGFKAVNDTHGHDAGDDLLVTLSQRMKDTLREGDTLARIGGDEFVAVLVDLQNADDCKPLLGRMLHSACSPVVVNTRSGPKDLQVSVSIGVTLFPRDNSDADLLLRHADQAMYVAKQSGKNRYHLFDVVQEEAIKTQQVGVERIRCALSEHELVLYYQPKVNMRTGRVTGAEALIRWMHPQRGLLAPGAFLPVIEGQPVSIEVGEWVVATALAQMGTWRALGLSLPVSVNTSAYELQQEAFAQRLGELLAACPGVPPSWLQLEVLETSALEDMGKVGLVMGSCHIMGVSFALDDFGTGYSSLTYLKRLPAETLKIDQSFVRDMLDDPGDLAIVNGVVGLAKSFGREVIAEGVETQAHGNALLALGCELAQGYGIARPMPADQVPQWVANWHQDGRWSA